MSRFDLEPTAIDGVIIVQKKKLGDDRGFLERVFCAEELPFPRPPVQVNRTLTRATGTVRGLHFQRPPDAEAKLVQCLSGAVFDVAVDLRDGSPTFGRSVCVDLSDENGRALLIPEGCAHGFQTLSADCELLYVHSAPYVPGSEGGIHHASPLLGILWPLAVTQLSARDAALPPFAGDFVPLGAETAGARP